ncbi:TPT-domain-containing protein [Punctularia strigosozonata HHB-11173 SS5]|uniref:TPT-domain-containing protein n=1 Tax=Punctularia strigosozonata (strain HHB-11173) TaxID=741275 RepID=UPI0004417C3B|nr:TPT-domain-containing protein [Punctularia strigosozonata HHB-11173 SS5]EIN09585.1 TPT-domain-containing protein [Punctularia strigosozonata HHB-11173 SS5]
MSPLSMHNSWTERWRHAARRWMRRYLPRAESRPSITTSTSEKLSSLTTIPSPATLRFIVLCGLWYTTSALSSNTGKVILNQFRYPVTLTIVQFAFVAAYCIIAMSPLVRFSRFRTPTRAIIRTTLPMGMFQVGGHMFSSMAISRIPVSTVHTIKALSPLFTVAAYALLFGVSYSFKTYISLLPLTVGVMLACTFDMSGSNMLGLLCAFGSAIVFVSSNIFFKKVMPSGGQTSSHKLDKTNLLFYSSGMAFLLMIPIWVWSDLPSLMAGAEAAHPSHGHSAPHGVAYYFFMNGTVHFAQNIIAFIILASVSPVTYSIASLIKRVAVICIAIVWFNQSVHPVQGVGIGMTFFGLWMYNNAKGDVEKGENKMKMVEAVRDMRLPTTKAEQRVLEGGESPPPEYVPEESRAVGATTGAYGAYGRSRGRSIMQPPPTASYKPYELPQPSHHQSHAAGLQIKILPPTAENPSSYPSPPPSLDSPPSHSAALPQPIAVG